MKYTVFTVHAWWSLWIMIIGCIHSYTKKQGCGSASMSGIETFTRYMLHLDLLEAPLSIAYLHLRSSSTFWEVQFTAKSQMRKIDTTLMSVR